MILRIKCWWWRIWTFRKEKFKIITHPPNMFETGDTLTCNEYDGYLLYLGKGYYIPCKKGQLKYESPWK